MTSAPYKRTLISCLVYNIQFYFIVGESPSSSASDVDNLNNQVTLDKSTSARGVSSPQVAGNHVVVARSRPNFVRLLNYVSGLLEFMSYVLLNKVAWDFNESWHTHKGIFTNLCIITFMIWGLYIEKTY